MLDKLFVRVRSWLHNDPTGVLGDPSLPAPGIRSSKSGRTPPPPLPPDAWKKEQESGMVITESGIIIIDPNVLDSAPPARGGKGIPEDTAWALPSLPRPGASSPVPSPMSTSATTTTSSNRAGADALNWDEVLAR